MTLYERLTILSYNKPLLSKLLVIGSIVIMNIILKSQTCMLMESEIISLKELLNVTNEQEAIRILNVLRSITDPQQRADIQRLLDIHIPVQYHINHKMMTLTTAVPHEERDWGKILISIGIVIAITGTIWLVYKNIDSYTEFFHDIPIGFSLSIKEIIAQELMLKSFYLVRNNPEALQAVIDYLRDHHLI
jgi:uncharacterized membrane protein